jgi:2-oxoglutarate ferredoxin oxidoreductase subunit beta
MPDGSHIYLKKLAEDYDPTSRERALATIHEARSEEKLITGLLYAEPGIRPFEEELGLGDAPLATLPIEQVRPPKSVLDAVMEQLKTGKGMAAPAGGG